MGGALFGARALQKTPGQRFRGLFPRSGPVQHILLDIDDDEDDEYEENQKDDEDDEDADEDDEDDEENEDDDEFEDGKGRGRMMKDEADKG